LKKCDWELRIFYRAKGSRSEGQHGALFFKGKEIPPGKTGDEKKTPFGLMMYYGNTYELLWETTGWNFKDKGKILRSSHKSHATEQPPSGNSQNDAQAPPDIIIMNSKVYEKHTKGLVTFQHKKHFTSYRYRNHKYICKDCHHIYEEGVNVWKEGKPVQKCYECHKEAKAPQGKDAPRLSTIEKIRKYHYSAIHEQCIGCHKWRARPDFGATACKDCHPKH
jgi:hypothetical protein